VIGHVTVAITDLVIHVSQTTTIITTDQLVNVEALSILVFLEHFTTRQITVTTLIGIVLEQTGLLYLVLHTITTITTDQLVNVEALSILVFLEHFTTRQITVTTLIGIVLEQTGLLYLVLHTITTIITDQLVSVDLR
jgi:hypothetical protein